MSKLEDISAPFRKIEITRNQFNYDDEYTNGNPEELSPIGKDTNNGETGSAADIAQRKKLIAKNKFDYNREYNAGND
jgi:hypothetical protein